MFIFNRISSLEHGIIVIEDNHLDKPKKKVEYISVPGRTGELIIDDGSEENLKINIKCVVDAVKTDDLAERMEKIEKWLKIEGYNQLIFPEDNTSFNASCDGELKLKLITRNLAELTITFSCYKGVN